MRAFILSAHPGSHYPESGVSADLSAPTTFCHALTFHRWNGRVACGCSDRVDAVRALPGMVSRTRVAVLVV